MADKQTWPKTQHYVPRFLLKNFGLPGKDQVHVFDKREGRVFQANVAKIAAETGLYDIKLPAGIVSAESALSNLEGAASAAINKILLKQSVKAIDQEGTAVLAVFIATQMLRVTHQVEILHQMTELIRSKWGTMPGMPNEAESRKQARESMVQNLQISLDLVPHLLNKTWLLLKAHPDLPF